MPPPIHSHPHISQHLLLDHQTKTKTTLKKTIKASIQTKPKPHISQQTHFKKITIGATDEATHTIHITTRTSISANPNPRHHDLQSLPIPNPKSKTQLRSRPDQPKSKTHNPQPTAHHVDPPQSSAPDPPSKPTKNWLEILSPLTTMILPRKGHWQWET